MEEHTVRTKKVLTWLIRGIGLFHVLLWLLLELPLLVAVIALLAHWEYYSFLGSFPFFRMPSISFFVSLSWLKIN